MSRFKLRFNHLMYRHQPFIRVCTELLNVITLKARGHRQDDIGKTTGCCPLMIQNDHGFQLLPRLDHAVTILLRMERIGGAENRHFDIRES